MYTNMYICKNLFWFQIEQYSTFGEKNSDLLFVPVHYGIKRTKQANLKYRMDNLPPEHEDLRKLFEERACAMAQYQEPRRTNISSMTKKPI